MVQTFLVTRIPVRFMTAILVGILALVTVGCKDERPLLKSLPASGEVHVTTAYSEYYGEAPLPEEGVCFARVWFFPLRDDLTSLMPVPLFLFDDQDEKRQIVRRLFEMSKYLDRSGPYMIPFPEGMFLRGTKIEGQTVAVNIESVDNPMDTEQQQAVASILVATLLQFDDVERVALILNGRPWPGMPEEGFAEVALRIVQPAPPRLLMAAGAWEPGETHPYEVLINFDRPMDIRNIDVRLSDGRPLTGEYFHSVFKMAVVIRPADRTLLEEGSKLKVKWSVIDRKGRSAAGEHQLKIHRP